MNAKNRSMFPFRRGSGKKRNRNAPNRRGGNGGPRRVPGSAAELLPLLQPATKAVAQVLAGNTRASGQVVHARNLLEQAERLVEERVVERLPPAMREEFFEQFARLKLTLADASDVQQQEQDELEEDQDDVPEAAPVPMERLRALALSLAAPAKPEETPQPPPEPSPAEAQALAEPETVQARPVEQAPETQPRTRRPGETLRLKSTRTEQDEDKHATASVR